MNTQSLARGLAFFSIGLGLAELLAPRRLARVIGVDEDNATLLRLFGLREIGTGMGILQGSSAGFVWGRVAGDVVDLSCLGLAMRQRGTDQKRAAGAMAVVAGVTVLDVIGAMLLTRNPSRAEWRVSRMDPAAPNSIPWRDPIALRRYADDTMTEHASGHLHEVPEWRRQAKQGASSQEEGRQMRDREDAAIQQFEPGD
ncbi:hypothetical protein [Opitutus sp. ER46]|uniref:hypothetical protein n=1 Tax=Opitutus sp. ER46 TaxID=2161864 RepID=UPI0018EE7234|nr:hypothetical protein [Opitutus sp. ER46]